MFKHRLLPHIEVNVEYDNNKRYYSLKDGRKFPSVTSIIGERLDKSGLEEWKKRVGEEEAKKKSIAGDVKASWGEQMRSYVMAPYQMVKDLRTGEQTSDVQAVLDGEIDAFLNAFLKGKKRSGPIEDEEEE